MTAYAFDLDGTLDRPAIRQLANDLFDAGHEVYVVTGGLDDSGEWTMAARTQRCHALGIRYTEIIRCICPDYTYIGRLKGEECHRLGAILLFDDSIDYLRAARAMTQATLLWVQS